MSNSPSPNANSITWIDTRKYIWPKEKNNIQMTVQKRLVKHKYIAGNGCQALELLEVFILNTFEKGENIF